MRRTLLFFAVLWALMAAASLLPAEWGFAAGQWTRSLFVEGERR